MHKNLRIEIAYKHATSECRGTTRSGWCATVYDPSLQRDDGVTAVYSTAICINRKDSADDAMVFCLHQYPNRDVIIE